MVEIPVFYVLYTNSISEYLLIRNHCFGLNITNTTTHNEKIFVYNLALLLLSPL